MFVSGTATDATAGNQHDIKWSSKSLRHCEYRLPLAPMSRKGTAWNKFPTAESLFRVIGPVTRFSHLYYHKHSLLYMQFIVAVEKPRSYNPMIALDIFLLFLYEMHNKKKGVTSINSKFYFVAFPHMFIIVSVWRSWKRPGLPIVLLADPVYLLRKYIKSLGQDGRMSLMFAITFEAI